MSSIKLGTKISSLLVQRNLATATSALQTNYERLSSGLRINSAKDDAAGLALSTSLNADAQVYTQAVRNVNDGISMMNIAEAALRELSNIVTRQVELAEMASNGSASRTQRVSVQEEMNALVEEYNRILNSTEYNDIELLSSTSKTVSIQAGATNTDTIEVEFGDGLTRVAGDGTFQTAISVSAGDKPRELASADLDGDGITDLISVDCDTGVGVYMGNGDGTFEARVSFTTYGMVWGIDIADFDGDGNIDLATANQNGDPIAIFLGNGDGSFKAKTSFQAGVSMLRIVAGDYNGDGIMDVASTSYDTDSVYVLLGNGDGSFREGTSFTVGDKPIKIITGDFNGDGINDLATANYGSNNISVLIGQSSGSFQTAINYTTTAAAFDLQTADVNQDGILDIVTAEWVNTTTPGYAGVFLGNSDGSFYRDGQYSGGNGTQTVRIADVDGDGILDLALTNTGDNTISILLGSGNGTFSGNTSFDVGDEPGSLLFDDFNNDNVLDLAVANYPDDSISMLLGNTQNLVTESYLNISTQEEALLALTEAQNTLDRVTTELGNVGAVQSRFSYAVSNLQQVRENYLTAYSQIMDVDVAWEAAELVRNQILQQAASSVLAQANQQPQLALSLIEES